MIEDPFYINSDESRTLKEHQLVIRPDGVRWMRIRKGGGVFSSSLGRK